LPARAASVPVSAASSPETTRPSPSFTGTTPWTTRGEGPLWAVSVTTKLWVDGHSSASKRLAFDLNATGAECFRTLVKDGDILTSLDHNGTAPLTAV
jgi:hypothetical protein